MVLRADLPNLLFDLLLLHQVPILSTNCCKVALDSQILSTKCCQAKRLLAVIP